MTNSGSRIDHLEENIIALLLGIMTVLTFANVVARYVFVSNIFWALELTVFLFAWLVLLGASYAVKKTAHLGVDALVNMASPERRRTLALVVTGCCILYAALLMKGAWDYWAPYANLPPTEGRWFPMGFVEKFRGNGWYETQDIPVPFFLRWLEDVFNGGAEYEKLPKVVPYLVMPLSMALLLFRFVQAGARVWRGEIDMMIVSHEAEDDVAEAGKALAEEEGK
ncbi:C4-dicarboxylate ABC transporter permease [Amylibacter marinus]|uniref:TRAP transporter small permease protein n=1 Tax=Amylibacter marinus TaxID=1475483 RepID=A0ABQ5VY38_9RHOB|nr:TRAP transporter small permease [Amylibacter marinus]GLQ36141.1 C4-dicarboxylate ABC transporter permease [Amylibacter marinus]